MTTVENPKAIPREEAQVTTAAVAAPRMAEVAVGMLEAGTTNRNGCHCSSGTMKSTRRKAVWGKRRKLFVGLLF